MARIKTDYDLKKMGQLYFKLNSCAVKNDQKSIMLCFPFDRVIWYLSFKVHKMRKDDWEYSPTISAQLGPKMVKLSTLQAVGMQGHWCYFRIQFIFIDFTNEDIEIA